MTEKRAKLVREALDALTNDGVSAMSLRPLARAIGTSDRMLIHYFGTREGLVQAVLAEAFERLASARDSDADSTSDVVISTWRAVSAPAALSVVRVYLEASALAHSKPAWRDMLAPMTGGWLRELEHWLRGSGVSEHDAPHWAGLVSATIDGCLLRLGLEGPSPDLDAVVARLSAVVRAQAAKPLEDRRYSEAPD